jgi:hypothetical protein
MGSFSLVVTTLACVRCGRERQEVQVQFKTGDEHRDDLLVGSSDPSGARGSAHVAPDKGATEHIG